MTVCDPNTDRACCPKLFVHFREEPRVVLYGPNEETEGREELRWALVGGGVAAAPITSCPYCSQPLMTPQQEREEAERAADQEGQEDQAGDAEDIPQ